MDPKTLGQQPASPFAQTSETFQYTGTQHAGLTKRESFAQAALSRVGPEEALRDADTMLALLAADEPA